MEAARVAFLSLG